MEKGARDKTLHHLPYALLVVGSASGGLVSTIVANWAMQVSFSPCLVAIAIERDSRIRGFIETSGFFSINFLPARKSELAKAFLKPKVVAGSAIQELGLVQADNGSPFLEEGLASVECRLVNAYPTGDHVTFIGEVSQAIVHRDGDVLTLRESGLRYLR